MRFLPVIVPLMIASTTMAQQPARLVHARQLVVVTTGDWNATTGTLQRFERGTRGAAWHTVGAAVPVVIGRSGLAWDASLGAAPERGAPIKREGDGRSPAGVFSLVTAFGFAPADSVGWLRLPYRALADGTDCVDDTTSRHYNTIVDRGALARVDWSSAEHMRSIGQYRLGVVVAYNASPPKRGRGSCIFLHIWNGPSSTTAGCTALDATQLTEVARWLDPKRAPVMVQLTKAAYGEMRGAWRLPAITETRGR